MKPFKSIFRAFFISLLLLGAVSCVSYRTARKVPEGKYLLANNIVSITNSNKVHGSELSKYLTQSPTKMSELGFNALFVDPVIFDSTALASSEVAINSHLEFLGFYNSQVKTAVNTSRKKATVNYEVAIGKAYPIKSIDYIIRDSVIYKIYTNELEGSYLKVGDRLSESNLELESERAASILRNNGYYGFTKNYFFYYADTTSAQDGALLSVVLENYTRNEAPSAARQHTAYTIGSVAIEPQGNLRVKESFLKYLNQIESNSLYNESAINNSYQRFTSNRLFSSVNIEMTPRDSSYVDCKILLSPSKLQSIGFNLEGSVNSTGLFGVNPTVSYTNKNLFGGGEYLTLGIGGNYQFMIKDPKHTTEFSLSSTLSLPRFLLLPSRYFSGPVLPKTNLSLSFNSQKRPEYERSILSTSYGYSWNHSQNLRFQWYPFRINAVNVFDMDEAFFSSLSSSYLQYTYQSHLDIGGGVNMLYTTAPETNPKRSYFYARFQGDISGNILSMLDGGLSKNSSGKSLIFKVPYAQYARGELSLVQTSFFGREKKMSLAARLLGGVGYSYGNSEALPLEQRFYAGGANSLRGWHSRTVGPGNSQLDPSFKIANQTGDMHLEANLELRFPIFSVLNSALFADAGNVWNLSEGFDDTFSFKNLSKSLAFSWGLGLRLDVTMLLIRVDLGIKGYDPAQMAWRKPNEWFAPNGYTIHFGVGYPF